MSASTSRKFLAIEERRLRTAFLPILLLAAGVPAAVACGTELTEDDGTSTSMLSNDEGDGDSGKGKGKGSGTLKDGGVMDLEAGACASQPTIPPNDPDAAADTCIEFKQMACGLPAEYEAIADGCYLSISQCYTLCHRLMRPCHAYGDSCVDGGIPHDRPITIECAICPGAAGRRPEGFDSDSGGSGAAAASPAPPPVGAFFAEVARLEAAAIDAFDRLRDELSEHGAPQDLVTEAELARKDEIAHTRTMSRLARRHGGRPLRLSRAQRAPRTLHAVARENMVEGCVRETFGALIAAWQAAHAPDAEIAQALDGIARDELRHAALSWEVAKWSDALLTDEQRAEIASARDEAITALFEETQKEPHPELVAVAGLPSGELQKRLLRGMCASLWAA